MTKVIKIKGGLEPYDPNKINDSLRKATIDAGYGVEEKKDIINEVFTNKYKTG